MKEIDMKPDWKDAPEWANWLAMDKTGEWWWYENEPMLYPSFFRGPKLGKAIMACTKEQYIESKEKRP